MAKRTTEQGMKFIVETYSKSGWCTRAWRTDTLKRALETLDDIGERAGPYFLIREIGAKGSVVQSLGVHTCPACAGRGVELDSHEGNKARGRAG